jgi:hypothetical protein
VLKVFGFQFQAEDGVGYCAAPKGNDEFLKPNDERMHKIRMTKDANRINLAVAGLEKGR